MRRVLCIAGAVVVSMILWPAASRGASAGAPAVTATVSVSRVSAAGRLAEATRALLRQRERELLACYRQELSDDREPTTRVSLSWTLRANGSIATPKAEFPDPRADDAGFAFLACLKERAAGWRYREPVAGAPVEVGLTFSRQGGKPAAPPATAMVGSISREELGQVLQAHAGEISQCYEQALALDGTLEGKVKLRWTVRSDGVVADVKVDEAGTTLASHDAVQCMVARVGAWRFPSPKGGAIAVITNAWTLRTQAQPAKP